MTDELTVFVPMKRRCSLASAPTRSQRKVKKEGGRGVKRTGLPRKQREWGMIPGTHIQDMKLCTTHQKCAQPGRLSGSLRCPTPTSILAAALSAEGSETIMTSIPFGRVKYLWGRSSVGGRMRETGPSARGRGGQGGNGDAMMGEGGRWTGWGE